MVTRSYTEIQAQIESLQEEAKAAREAEIAAVLEDIREKVATYGLTPQDVFGRKRSAKGAAGAKPASAIKYRDPKTGATWSGKGRAPGWITKARNRDKFLVEVE
ncbi:H-NS histone family protein [Burkholderia vietnamiensis]|uniref:H-NS histone family protein n=1 Tax=Burkholderia vietnamiensis TaxID=60552 RepID=UPI001B9C3F53|nr:H-NS histone family protein [Burkholderia vietnamiensis]MBR8085578.1 H-NS histone family protein [Burkholderia vietnamiensis]